MDIFTALAEPTRRSIVRMLAERGELAATEISDEFDSSPPAISQHLKILREAHVVRMEKRSRQRIYKINPSAIEELDRWVKQTTEMWNRRLDKLDILLQTEKKKLKKQKHGK